MFEIQVVYFCLFWILKPVVFFNNHKNRMGGGGEKEEGFKYI